MLHQGIFLYTAEAIAVITAIESDCGQSTGIKVDEALTHLDTQTASEAYCGVYEKHNNDSAVVGKSIHLEKVIHNPTTPPMYILRIV